LFCRKECQNSFLVSDVLISRRAKASVFFFIQQFLFTSIQIYFVSMYCRTSALKSKDLQLFIISEDLQLFILTICAFNIVVVTLFTNLIYLSYSFMKLYKRCRFCEQNYYHFPN
jgi:hypothetical protein